VWAAAMALLSACMGEPQTEPASSLACRRNTLTDLSHRAGKIYTVIFWNNCFNNRMGMWHSVSEVPSANGSSGEGIYDENSAQVCALVAESKE
jgi:hypothetical protein